MVMGFILEQIIGLLHRSSRDQQLVVHKQFPKLLILASKEQSFVVMHSSKHNLKHKVMVLQLERIIEFTSLGQRGSQLVLHSNKPIQLVMASIQQIIGYIRLGSSIRQLGQVIVQHYKCQ